MANPRADFSPMFQRQPLRLPDQARVAVWPAINVAEWDINEPMARTVFIPTVGETIAFVRGTLQRIGARSTSE